LKRGILNFLKSLSINFECTLLRKVWDNVLCWLSFRSPLYNVTNL